MPAFTGYKIHDVSQVKDYLYTSTQPVSLNIIIHIMADISRTLPLTRDSVIEAHKLIRPYVHYTPVLTNRTITELASKPRTAEDLEGTRYAGRTPARPVLRLWFKCENMQRIGAFKARGAFHAVERLKQEPGWLEGGGKEKGVVTHSSGKIMEVHSVRDHYLTKNRKPCSSISSCCS